MLSTLLLSAMLTPAAPLPKAVPASSSAPVILELKPETDGTLKVFVTRQQKGVVNSVLVIDPNGGPPVSIEAPQAPATLVKVPLAEVKDLKVFTAAGKEVKLADAAAQLKAGGVVVISTDGKKVDPIFTRVLKDDTLVLVSPEFAQVRRAPSSDLPPPVPTDGRGIQGTPPPEERPILVTPPKKEEK